MARCWKEVARNRSDSLHTEWNYFVHVCSFTFVFLSLKQIEEYREYFSQKIHPSSADGHERSPFPGDHWEHQSRFDELPFYLFEEPKRLKVVKALERAFEQFSKE